MGIFNLDSEQLFLRSAGKSRLVVVKLTKDVHSDFVETKDWEVVEMIGNNMNCDTLQIFGHKITSQDLMRLATNLTQSRLWINKDGISFLRIGVTTSSSLITLFNQIKDLFNWAEFGVKIPKSLKNDDKEKQEFDEMIKKLEQKVQQLTDDVKNKVESNSKERQESDEKIKNLERRIESLTKDVKSKGEEIARLNKSKSKERQDSDEKIKNLEKKIENLTKDVKNKSKEIKRLNEVNGEKQKDYDEDIEKLERKIESLREDVKNKAKEIERLNKLDSSSSSSSSSARSSVVTQYDQILHKWRRPVWSIRFNTLNSSYALNLSPDFNFMPTYRAVDEVVIGKFPNGINVYVNDGSFQKDNWWFVKIKDEDRIFESLFAFYGGIYASTTAYYGAYQVKIPYNSSAIFRANVRFFAVALRGYGAVFGFCFNH